MHQCCVVVPLTNSDGGLPMLLHNLMDQKLIQVRASRGVVSVICACLPRCRPKLSSMRAERPFCCCAPCLCLTQEGVFAFYFNVSSDAKDSTGELTIGKHHLPPTRYHLASAPPFNRAAAAACLSANRRHRP